MMMSDDDDAEPQLRTVQSYYLLDAAGEPVSFSTLPLLFGDAGDNDVPECKKRLVLRGTADPGIKVYKEVVAWRLGLEGKQPEVAVLAADGGWINLVKPKNSYEETVRTVLITAQMLHFIRRKPDDPENNLWNHLRKVFDKFDVRPSEDDFRNHHSLIKLFADKDPALSKSEVLRVLIEARSRKNIIEVGADNIEIKQPFIADDEEIYGMVADDNNNESDEEEDEDLFDSICAICDNGGDLLCCDGPCMRSFHAKEGTGEDSYCDTLGYTEAEVEAMKIFLCKNCEYKQHQCFICGVLEPSDGAAAKVFLCNNATCGHFYHPKCVAQQLHPNNRNEASELEKKITDGFSFTCPIHWCFHCKGLEDRTQEPLQFAVCRRCPKSYHRKCLPSEISFQDIEDEDIITRAWELSKRILIYCMDHEIDSEIDTPVRDHIKFPKIEKIEKTAEFIKKKAKSLIKKKKRTYSESVLGQTSKEPAEMTDKVYLQEREQTTRKVPVKISSENLVDKPEKKKAKFLKEKIQVKTHMAKDGSISSPKPAKEQEQEIVPLPSSATRKIPLSSFPTVDSETEKRVIALLGKEVSSLTLKDVSRKCRVPSTHVYSGRQIDRIIAQGKLERSVQAVGAALKKLENGGNIDDSKAVCEPEVLRQLARWHSKLRVYISPFIHGTRYSSFGRHFTKVEKLVEIVDKLHWYVDSGDMIVDFCCGANDFCRLMKEKLDHVKKKCHFKNYDLIQPQNHFCFEKRDWMTVQPNELPRGSQLIMGLNPPFGVKASLANKFIDKALAFNPKLIVLIVPKETKRLDQKKTPLTPYDLVWEDSECLAGKVFYLPGSVDLNDKTVEGWNASAPPLYLWSHPDWTKKHKKIAEEHNHACIGKRACHIEEVNLSDDLLKKEAESSDKLNARSGKEKENTGKMSCHPKEDNISDDLPTRKQAEAGSKWNSGSGKERYNIDKTVCNVSGAILSDERPAKKHARSEEEKETLVKNAFHVKEADRRDNLSVKRKAESTREKTSQSGKEKVNGRDESRSSDNWSRKWAPDQVDNLPPEKQVEVAYEETKVIPSKKSIHKEQRLAHREDERNAHRDESKSALNYEKRAAVMSNIKFREGGDSDMSISSPDNSNARSKSRSQSPFIPTEHTFERRAHLDSYMSGPAKEPFVSALDRATYEGSYLASNDEYYALKRKNDPTFYVEIDNSTRKSGSNIEDMTKIYGSAPTGGMYSLQPRGDDGSFYRRQNSEEWNTSVSERSPVADMPMQGHLTRYGGQVGDSYLQTGRTPPVTSVSESPVADMLIMQGHLTRYGGQVGDSYQQTGRTPPVIDSQAQLRMHGAASADDYLQTRYYSLGSSAARFGQPASTTHSFGLSGASAPRGSVMDKYAYGLSSPSGPQNSVMDKYTPSLDGTNNKKPTSVLPKQYPYG
ncbi:protein ENHANCED DOWNY MILDEW 2-like [Phragmites australis]|uniref:protein ENHANCED DOWNY MILDEW 2-like n=1 Tax=Phragmites australis TaxID=29695 RepID=UPI002D76F17C|nr:protein ENHANCED DOWNY MILDEW 2-like [Phragmites australis]